jgi:hypothetical protein
MLCNAAKYKSFEILIYKQNLHYLEFTSKLFIVCCHCTGCVLLFGLLNCVKIIHFMGFVLDYVLQVKRNAWDICTFKLRGQRVDSVLFSLSSEFLNFLFSLSLRNMPQFLDNLFKSSQSQLSETSSFVKIKEKLTDIWTGFWHRVRF